MPTMRAEKDIGSENPKTTTVSGFSKPISFSVRNVGRVGRTRYIIFVTDSCKKSVLRIYPVAVPGRSCARRSGLASCRPLPLARLPPPAPGGGRLAPPTSCARRSHNLMVAAKHAAITKENTTRFGWCFLWLVAPKKISFIRNIFCGVSQSGKISINQCFYFFYSSFGNFMGFRIIPRINRIDFSHSQFFI